MMPQFSTFDSSWVVLPILWLTLMFVGAILVFVLVLWIAYTVIWRGVRRGLEEYYGPGEGSRPRRESPGAYLGFATYAPPEPLETESLTRDRRHRSGRLSR